MALSQKTVPAEDYAAICVAVGWLRGALESATTDNIDREELRRILDATATAEIAKVLGKKEADLFIDWNLYLTEKQKHAIAGDR